MARAATSQAIAALIRKLDDPDDCIEAAVALLDRGWGRPAQAILAQVNGSVLVSGIDKPPEITEDYEQWLDRRRNELDALEHSTRCTQAARSTQALSAPHQLPPPNDGAGAASEVPTEPRMPGGAGPPPSRPLTAAEEVQLQHQRRRLGLDDDGKFPNPSWRP
jgi:hypothetical protein